MRFADKIAVVTGAASGIGAATAARLRSEGATVVGLDVATADGVEVCDITDEGAVNSSVAGVVAEHGRLDVVCNVAGVLRMSRLEELTLDAWNQMISVNLTGLFLMSKAVMPHLVESRGSMVNVASISGLQGQPYNAGYTASKSGVVGLSRSLAVEFADRGVRVNYVCPGGVDTPMVHGQDMAGIGAEPNMQAMTRMMPLIDGLIDPSEIAGAIAYLASDDARSVSGASLVVDRATLCN